eukprot:1829041-Pleurochrysis_carterae.AAC.1
MQTICSSCWDGLGKFENRLTFGQRHALSLSLLSSNAWAPKDITCCAKAVSTRPGKDLGVGTFKNRLVDMQD